MNTKEEDFKIYLHLSGSIEYDTRREKWNAEMFEM